MLTFSNPRLHDIYVLEGAGGAGGASQAVVGVVLGAKAAAQLLAAPLAGAAVCRRGAAPVLRAATATLAGAAVVFACVSGRGGWRAALVVAAGRAAHGAGAALAAVAGLALAARALPASQRDRAIGALLGAVALGKQALQPPRRGPAAGSGSTASAGVAGVLVGYPFGGATYALWSRGAPFLLIAAALLADLGEMAAAAGPRVPATSTKHESTGVSGLQYVFLDKEEYNRSPLLLIPDGNVIRHTVCNSALHDALLLLLAASSSALASLRKQSACPANEVSQKHLQTSDDPARRTK
ncbi:hypothetical protein HW555_006752 [Spodoptera exigua]|uniref:Uncharacterized protein n=1 Tax=Spodoptera exigua TaxID=7107 RepID=A0A835GIJ0_SPOEX|nr:hypothetical protein HW555_006752 [Spodoptera exigua]